MDQNTEKKKGQNNFFASTKQVLNKEYKIETSMKTWKNCILKKNPENGQIKHDT